MKKIRLFHNGYQSSELLSIVNSWNIVYNNDNNRGGFIFKDLEFVADDSYEYAIFLDFFNKKIKDIPINHIVGYYGEPYEISNLPEYIGSMKGTFGTFYVPQLFNDEKCFKEGMPFLAPSPYPYSKQKKNKKMSIIASSKYGQLYGYKLRHFLINKILQSNLNIDIYGRGLCHLYRDPRVKGAIDSKNTALIDYKFSIAIENTKYNCYTSEKLYDCLLRDCIPLYWGAKKVGDVIDKNSIIILPDNPESCWELIKTIYHDDCKFTVDVAPGANSMRTTCNWLEHVYNHFNNI